MFAGVFRITHGDCLDVMRGMEPVSVDSIVSDPPYGLSFMGKDWDHGVPGVHFWEEALRVAKPGAHLLAFGGTRTFHRLTCAIEDAGWEMRDTLMWVYGSGFPKSHNLKGEHEGWGTALKPAWEPIIMARKPLVGTVAQNVLAHGTGAINVDGCRVDGPPYSIWNYTGGGDCTAFRETRSGGPHITKQQQGRWPANLIHDGSDEVLGMFPNTTSGRLRAEHATGQNPWTDSVRPPFTGEWGGDSGSAARFFYCAKASKADRDEGLEGFEEAHKAAADFRPNHAEKAALGEDGNPYGRWNKVRNTHPTVKPTALMRYLCRLVTPPNGTVFDPFTGSGSTGKAAILEGFNFEGCDLQAEYVSIARARCEHSEKTKAEHKPPPDLFTLDAA